MNKIVQYSTVPGNMLATLSRKEKARNPASAAIPTVTATTYRLTKSASTCSRNAHNHAQSRTHRERERQRDGEMERWRERKRPRCHKKCVCFCGCVLCVFLVCVRVFLILGPSAAAICFDIFVFFV